MRKMLSLIFSAALVSTLGLFTLVAAQEVPGASCAAPYPPVFGPSEALPLVEVSPVPSTPALPTVDLGGGSSIVPVTGTPGAEVVVNRPSGQLVITASGMPISGYSAGDMDQDGISDIWVQSGTSEPELSWVIPSATPNGAVDVATAGIAVVPGIPYATIQGPDDPNPVVYSSPSVSFPGTQFATWVLNGPAIMAIGAGGDATGVAPLAEFDQYKPLARIKFSSGTELLLSTFDLLGGGPELTIQSAGDGNTIQFIAKDGLDIGQNRSPKPPVYEGLEGAGGRYLLVTADAQFSGNDREGPLYYAWSYDAPCTVLQAAEPPNTTATTTVTTTTPPQQPSDMGSPLRLTG